MAIVGLAAYTNGSSSTALPAMLTINAVANLKVVEMKNEVWRPIIGYENQYEVSNYSRIKSIDRTVKRGNNILPIKERILKPVINNRGYFTVSLCKDAKYKHVCNHRIAAIIYIPNPEKKLFINHKDGIKINNYIDNLEWSTCSENNQHAYDIGLKIGAATGKFGKDNPSSKEVYQIDKFTNKIITQFDSVHDIHRELGFAVTNIAAACRGTQNTSHGFIWKYKNELS